MAVATVDAAGGDLPAKLCQPARHFHVPVEKDQPVNGHLSPQPAQATAGFGKVDEMGFQKMAVPAKGLLIPRSIQASIDFLPSFNDDKKVHVRFLPHLLAGPGPERHHPEEGLTHNGMGPRHGGNGGFNPFRCGKGELTGAVLVQRSSGGSGGLPQSGMKIRIDPQNESTGCITVLDQGLRIVSFMFSQ